MAVKVEIESLAGSCPVQSEGTFNGIGYYFRARGSAWSIGVGGDPITSPDWYYEEPYGEGPFDAGYMPLDVAAKFIASAGHDWHLQQSAGKDES